MHIGRERIVCVSFDKNKFRILGFFQPLKLCKNSFSSKN